MDDNAHNPNYWWIKYIFNDTHSNCRQLATVHRSINQSVSIPESDVSSCDECLVSNCLHLLRTHSIHPHLAKLNPIKKHLSWNHQQVREYVYSTSQSPPVPTTTWMSFVLVLWAHKARPPPPLPQRRRSFVIHSFCRLPSTPALWFWFIMWWIRKLIHVCVSWPPFAHKGVLPPRQLQVPDWGGGGCCGT